ncbi:MULTISPECIES: DUF1697 domain-containing protein [Chryseobacterium]|uniref:Uncharacterized protein (DUF1697 family) n=1 Tax=Chryseobacterium camelliae TaxID=1265445 RepID=A0ABU0TGU9_9FLAO|nr:MULTISPECIES: DUF1697 domain-containing protein [Chryseobacterium]MDT3405910.1 uncharacterized protein (DUF1697 family) [Pseudacidovorax intermedius]MDQ1096285.1 uncharacterized protein (DUF1697 family) [Chryseobacterium camelliae]MDQ1100223.1 uncharacterized protein (DUF1697 family) [Chryseobacterium sp. SORGH_AS_1048]MDR6087567.1 uncharacterized protein (DUF1697 family) [Chryseobacterium sp. SORGH_AS_0909]MDR6131941.1 uncharacterized protein (DUF1697 family) [Chryseobacterium sp. SORGH_AS
MKYCAFLRGVNVKGTNMKMADVCQVFSGAGMENVSSVLASGNIVFTSDKNAVALRAVLEKSMSDHFSYEAFLFVKSREETENLRNGNPFKKNDDLHVYAFIGNEGIEEILMKEFNDASKAKHEEAAIINHIFYWQVPKGSTLDSSFGKILGRKDLKDRVTTRNINTFDKILKKMA